MNVSGKSFFSLIFYAKIQWNSWKCRSKLRLFKVIFNHCNKYRREVAWLKVKTQMSRHFKNSLITFLCYATKKKVGWNVWSFLWHLDASKNSLDMLFEYFIVVILSFEWFCAILALQTSNIPFVGASESARAFNFRLSLQNMAGNFPKATI